MNNNELNIHEWQQLVGKSVMAFGNIELVTYMCLAKLPSEYIFDVVSDLPFGKRVELTSRMIESKDIPEKLRNHFLELLKQASKKAEIRNLIAHNPLQISYYEQLNTGEIFKQPEIVHIKKKSKVITIEDLRKFSGEVEELSKNIYTLMRQIFKKIPRLEGE